MLLFIPRVSHVSNINIQIVTQGSMTSYFIKICNETYRIMLPVYKRHCNLGKSYGIHLIKTMLKISIQRTCTCKKKTPNDNNQHKTLQRLENTLNFFWKYRKNL